MIPTPKPGRIVIIRLLAAAALAATPVLAADAVAGAAEQQVTGDTITVTDEGVTITVPFGVDASKEITITGTGWLSSLGTGSTLALKLHQLDDAGIDEMLTRTDGIINHPRNGNPDPTIWALTTAGKDGSFSITTTLPDTLEAGQRFDIQVSSGLADDSDIRRSLKAIAVPVAGKPWVDPTGGETITCVPSTPSPTLSVDPRPNENHEIIITGTGFCHPTNGGSVVAFKIDDGIYKHVPGELVNSNATVWGLTKTDPETGDFTYAMRLPDGTSSGPFGSDPVFTPGVHTLRALTGSLKQGDVVRTLPTRDSHALDFVVGVYKPNAVPPPVGYTKDLVETNQYGITATLGEDNLTVTVPGSVEGDWFIPTLFLPDSSPVWPWEGQWFRTDDEATFTLPITKDVHIPAGRLKFALQSGNEGVQGTLMGWTWLEVDRAINPRGETPDAPGADQNTPETDQPARTDGGNTPDHPGFYYTNRDELFQLVENVGTVAGKADSTIDIVDTVFGLGLTASDTSRQSPVTDRQTTPRASAAGEVPTPQTTSSSAPETIVKVINRTITREVEVEGSSWVDQPRPETEPETPAPAASVLTDSTKGPVTSAVADDTMTVVVTDSTPGSWVYVTAYVDGLPHDIGWAQIDGKNSLTLDVSGIADGNHKIAIRIPEGLIGWAPLVKGEATPTRHAAADADNPSSATGGVNNHRPHAAKVQQAAAIPLIGTTDWLLIAGAAAITLLGALVVRRRTR